jgi:hypothetical protein
MFSPEASIQSARSSLRNPRRRQRKESDGLPQQPRRKRNKLNDETFKDPAHAHVNGNGSALTNGHAVQSVENSVVLVDMPVREKKAAPKRAPKEDHGIYLVGRLYMWILSAANQTYHVDQERQLQSQETPWVSISAAAPEQYAAASHVDLRAG